MTAGLDDTDRAIVLATQAGLPLVPRPYHAIAETLDVSPDDVMQRMRRLLATGVIRRIGVVPNHYKLGMTANGMSVWDVDDALATDLGRQVGALDYVSHCYLRPRHVPLWPYNLFAMVHGTDKAEVADKAAAIAAILGSACQGSDILYSTKILKKTGLRLAPGRSASRRHKGEPHVSPEPVS